MFRTRCPKCSEKISKKYDFCPYCGAHIKNINEEDYGLLGKNDDFENPFEETFSGFGGGMLNKMLGGAMKMLEKEMKEMDKEQTKITPKIPRTKFQLYINGKRINIPEINQENNLRKINQRVTNRLPAPSEETIKNSRNLPRKEAISKINRAGNRIIYEIELPETHSLEQILINKLEDSVEIRAYTPKAVLQKTIAIALPLIAYQLNQQRLFLEFQGK